MGVQTAREHIGRRLGGRRSNIDDDIARRRCMLMKAEPLAQHALQPIARNGAACGTHAHGEAKSGMIQSVGPHDHEEVGIGRTPTHGVCGVVLVLVGEAPAARKTVRR